MTPGPSFRFRLERVRALREQREDLAKQELAEAMGRRQRCEDELHAAETMLENARLAQRDAQHHTTGDGVQELRSHQAFIERLEQTCEAARRNLAAHEEQVEASLGVLGEAARERQTLERLKERRRADHQREADRREGRTLDELAINSHRRGRA